MTMISRVVGFFRDLVIAQFFGAGGEVDAFLVAFKIPNFMRRLFAEGAFSQAFVPVLAEYQQTQSKQKVNQFVGHIAGNLLCVLLVLTVICVCTTPYLIRVFAPGFTPDTPRFVLSAYMLKLTFPYLMLISLTALSGAVLNTYGRFAVPAFTPVLLNVSMIAASIYLAPLCQTPVTALAWGVLIAGVIQLLFQLPFLVQAGLFSWPKIHWRDKGVNRVLRLMVPALFGVSVAQVNLLIDTVFASFLMPGSVSWLYYSDRLTNFPLGVFGVAISTVILPHLSRKHASHSNSEFSAALDWGLRLILMIALPSMVGLFIFAKPLLAALLGYGKFSLIDVTEASMSLMAFAVGVPSFMLVKVLASAFYARQNISTPVKVAAIAMLVNTAFCFILIGPLQHAGLALASSISGLLNAGLLIYLLLAKAIYTPAAAWSGFLLRLLVANAVLVGWLMFAKGDVAGWMSLGASMRLTYLFLDVMIALLVYGGSLYALGFRWLDLKRLT